jgi:hypothetical protein
MLPTAHLYFLLGDEARRRPWDEKLSKRALVSGFVAREHADCVRKRGLRALFMAREVNDVAILAAL